MISAGTVATSTTIVVLLYSLYVANLLKWKLDAGPMLYFVVFATSFVILRLAVSPLVSMWANQESSPAIPPDVDESQPSPETCSALFQGFSGNLIDDMTGYSKEKPHLCPSAPPAGAASPNPSENHTPPWEIQPGLPPGSSFFHFCSPGDQLKPAGQSQLLPRSSPAPTSTKADTKQCSKSRNRYSFYD